MSSTYFLLRRSRWPVAVTILATIGTTVFGAVTVTDLRRPRVLLALVGCAVALVGWVVSAFAVLSSKSQALEIDSRGFRVYDAFGRLSRDCPWEDLDRLFVTSATPPLSPGEELRVAWLCRDGTPGARHRRQYRGDAVDGMAFDKQDRPASAIVELLLECQQAFAPESVARHSSVEGLSRVGSSTTF